MRLPAFVCLSVCLLARLLKNACTDLDEMLRVNRCRNMDELINFWTISGSWSGWRNQIAFSDIVYATELCSLAYSCQRAVLLSGILCRGKIPRIRIGGAPLEPAVVLKWFYSLSRRKTFVGGKCALPSALLVCKYNQRDPTQSSQFFSERYYRFLCITSSATIRYRNLCMTLHNKNNSI